MAQGLFDLHEKARPARPRARMVWAHQDLNLGPAGYEPAALNLAELWALAKASDRIESYQLCRAFLRDAGHVDPRPRHTLPKSGSVQVIPACHAGARYIT